MEGGNISEMGDIILTWYMSIYQGNGHEADFDGDEQVYIIDVYNAFIYPGDTKVKSRST